MSFWSIRQLAGRTRRRDLDRFGRADEFAKLAGDALGVAFLVFHEVGRAAIAFGHSPLFLGILQRHFLFEEMAQGDFEPADNGGHVKPLPEV